MERMSTQHEAVMVCPHVASSPAVAEFICRTQDGLVAACSADCSSLRDGFGLSLMGYQHILVAARVPEDMGALPVNCQLLFVSGRWSLAPFEDDTEPALGEFRIASSDDPLRQPAGGKTRWDYYTSLGRPVTVTLDEGIRALPIWPEGSKIPPGFLASGNGTEILQSEDLDGLKLKAKEYSIYFLAPNFLCNDFDIGLVV